MDPWANPFAPRGTDPWADDPFEAAMGRLRAGRPLPAVQPLPQPEADSLLTSMGDKALGGLSYVGGAISKALGGRAIRGLLGGKPWEALSLIPLSDTLGITDRANEVTGEQLLEKWGAIRPNDPNAWEARDFAGPALEIALDPITYLSFGGGALTKLGKTAGMVGRALPGAQGVAEALASPATKLAPTMAGRIAAGQGGLVGVGLPLMENAFTLGHGPLAQKVAGVLDKGWDKALYSRPGRYLSSLFDPSVHVRGIDLGSEAWQRSARLQNALLKRSMPDVLARGVQVGNVLDKGGMLDEVGGLRRAVEGVGGQPADQAIMDAAKMMQDDNARLLAEAQAKGRPLTQYQGFDGGYSRRQWTPREEQLMGAKGGRAWANETNSQKMREAILRNIRGETEGVNELLADVRLSGPKRTVTTPNTGAVGRYANESRLIRDEYLPEWGTLTNAGVGPVQPGAADALYQSIRVKGTPARQAAVFDHPAFPNIKTEQDLYRFMKGIRSQSNQLARKAAGMDPSLSAAKKAGEEGWRFFGNHPLADHLGGMVEHAQSNAAIDALFGTLARESVDAAAAPGAFRSVGDALKAAKLTGPVSQDLVNAFKSAGHQIGSVADLGKFSVPDHVFGDINRFVKAFESPEVFRPVVDAWDSFTNLMKAYSTSTWPAFQTRNQLTGFFMNAVGGAFDGTVAGGAKNPAAWVQPFVKARQLRLTGSFKGANAVPGLTHLTDAEASLHLLQEMFSNQVRVGVEGSQIGEVIGRGGKAIASPGKFNLPGKALEKPILDLKNPLGGGSILKDSLPKKLGDLNPLAVKGVGGRIKDSNVLVKAGREVGASIDDTNRVASYIAYRTQGMSQEMAALKSKMIHYDYASLTPFESNVMRRVFPFYNWMRKNAPFVAGQVLEKPGGLMSTSIRVTDRARQQEGYMPDYVGEGLAARMGQEKDGSVRYLTHLGLPFEDAFQVLNTGPKGLERSAQRFLSQTNPLIKAPLEIATGKQFMSGRDLGDLYGLTGNTIADQVIMNSPIARAATTARTLADPRKDLVTKAFNVVGPGKVTDVDIEKQRAAALEELVRENLKNNPNVRSFENLYVKPEMLPTLSPSELQVLRVYKTIQETKRKELEAQKKIGVKK